MKKILFLLIIAFIGCQQASSINDVLKQGTVDPCQEFYSGQIITNFPDSGYTSVINLVWSTRVDAWVIGKNLTTKQDMKFECNELTNFLQKN